MTDFEQDFDEGEDDALSPVSVEDRARAMGWKPQEEYGGDPRRWSDAQTFIDRGEAELPILRDQSRRMSEKLARQERDMADLRNTVSEQAAAVKAAMDLARRADSGGYKRAMDELKAKRAEAVAIGDTEAFEQVQEQIDAAEAERATSSTEFNVTVPAKQPALSAPLVDQETDDFMAANPWFHQKPILKQAMIDAHLAIIQREGSVSGKALTDQYEQAKAEVVEAFPQYFPTQSNLAGGEEEFEDEPRPRPRPRLRVAPLAPSSPTIQHRRGGDPFLRITDERERSDAKAAFASVVKYDPNTTAEEYVTLYLNPKTDVLALRARRGKA